MKIRRQFDQEHEVLQMSSFLARFARDESGAAVIEYALIAALIGLAIIVGAGSIGGEFGKLIHLIGTGFL